MLERLLEGLNPEQRRAVETTDGPLLIQAGAGSGKTRTLTHRVAYLIASKKASPFNILAVTFTNKAANEMRARVARLLGESADNRGFMPFMGTFHGICVRLLRQDGEAVGIPRSFVIFDESDRQAAVKQAAKRLMIDEKTFPARMLSSLIGSAKNEMLSPDEYARTAASPGQQTAAKVYPLYEKSLKEASALDFDDLINRTVDMLKTRPEIRAKWQNQFRYVMIDEYQDTNAAQYALVNLLTNQDRNIAVVGDDWQSIYSWRGADFRNILKFESDFKDCTVIKLEQNYRSTKNILDAAQAVITKNAQRSDKKLWTDAGDGLPVQLIQVGGERAETEAIIRRIR
ncbi:MAG: ATP-dependent helicase, partial [Candidatus Saccharimonadales bacterium]